MKIEEINKLVERLSRCVGGKLADDVAEAVKAMHGETEEAKTTADQLVEELKRDLDHMINERDHLIEERDGLIEKISSMNVQPIVETSA